MEKKMTKLEALKICKELWEWMRDGGKTSDADKWEWPGWEEYGRMMNHCPCCEHRHQNMTDCIPDCLLLNIWPNGCVEDISPYRPFWFEGGTPADAQKIIDGCTAAIEKIIKNNLTKPNS